MSDKKRFRKDYTVDGWPIADNEAGSILGTDDLVVMLNEMDAENKRLNAQYLALANRVYFPFIQDDEAPIIKIDA